MLVGGKGVIQAPPSRGFLQYPARPLFLFDSKKGRFPRDFEQFGDYWIVSDKAKQVFEAVDPQGFAFLACDVQFPDGKPGPVFWFCDVVRFVEAIDEAHSRMEIGYRQTTGTKFYALACNSELAFRDDVPGDVHVFRDVLLKRRLFCDQELRDACKAAGLKRPKFEDYTKRL